MAYDPGGAVIDTPLGQLRKLAAEGGLQHDGQTYRYELKCPGCSEWGLLDEDQLHGRVSVDHAAQGCAGGYHETHDFYAEIPEEKR